MDCLEEVTSFAHYLADTEWEAEDLVQATYERAFERWESLSDPDRCRAWLFRIARNQWIDWLRSRRAGPDLELVDPQEAARPRRTVGAETVSQLDEKQVREALEELPHHQAEAVVLCDIWGFTYEEIADVVDVPMGTVRSRISRGRSNLLEIIESFDPGADDTHRSDAGESTESS